MKRIARYKKAVAGLIGPAAALLIGAWFVTSPHVVTDGEWSAILTAAIAGGGTVAAAPKNREH
jgi:hypothetical protein